MEMGKHQLLCMTPLKCISLYPFLLCPIFLTVTKLYSERPIGWLLGEMLALYIRILYELSCAVISDDPLPSVSLKF